MRKSKKGRTDARTRKREPSSEPANGAGEEPTKVVASIPVVGVGASAGGLEPFTQILRALPPEPGLALVLVQHLSPTHESALPEILSKSTTLPVEQARNGMRILPNHIYVVPPNAELTVHEGALRVAPRPTDRTQYNSIDAFFRSLAEWAEARAIGVLLSGTSSDGVAGLREIRAAGGTVLVQDPATADYDVMPRAAIAAGIADLVLEPKQIPATLVRLVSHPLIAIHGGPASAVADVSFPEHQLRRIFNLLRNTAGVDFTHYKEPTIRRRLHRRMLLQKISSLDEYIKVLEHDGAELQNLYQDLLIQVTRFFREPETYDVLKERVFPAIKENRAPDAPIRVWVPGCATGEEAYSVAMVLLEFLGESAGGTPIQIFATDVSDKAIERARAGIYPETIAEDVSPQRLRRFFTKGERSYQISKAVRDLCVFAHQDLTRDPPFSKLDLIVCRNVLIYLDPVLHRKLMSVFHYALKPNGFLMLGRAESTGPFHDLFQIYDKKQRIFLRKSSLSRLDLEFQPMEPGSGSGRAPSQRKPAPRQRDGSGVQGEATRVLVSRFAPPGVIVDSELRIVQTRGQTGAFLELAPGEPTLNLFKMLREGLLFGVRTALNEARKSGQAVRKEGIKIKSNGHSRSVDVEVIPLSATSPGDRHYLVLFDRAQLDDGAPAAGAGPAAESKRRAARGKAKPGHETTTADPRVVSLQQELAASREYMQSIIQDLEATNEELQSANEEILSSNEELQSTNEELDTAKEELQSTNEEINTVNEELQSRNEELSRANSDLVNLLAGVQIAIVFVTNDLRIRRFTPMAEKALNLIPSDVGRPIGNIRPNIDCPDLEALIQSAIDDVTVKEREVQDRDGNWMLLRVRPYKSIENRIDGAVLVLLDIDALRRHEQRSLEATRLVEAVLDSVEQPLVVLDGALRVTGASRAFTRGIGKSAAEIAGRSLDEIDGGRWSSPELRARLTAASPGDGNREPIEVLHDLPGPGDRRTRVRARKIGGGSRVAPLFLLTVEEMPRA